MQELPVVYSCSGCSSAAQMANELALQLSSRGLAEMSCIAGVGGGVKALVKKAKSAKTILGIDGCPLHCVRACLAQQGLDCDWHLDLSQCGVAKLKNTMFDKNEAEQILNQIQKAITSQWQQTNIPGLRACVGRSSVSTV